MRAHYDDYGTDSAAALISLYYTSRAILIRDNNCWQHGQTGTVFPVYIGGGALFFIREYTHYVHVTDIDVRK